MANNTVQWQVGNLDRSLPDGDQYPEGKVYSAGWYATYEENGESAYAYGSVGFGEADPQHYTPYSQLTQEEVLQWVFETLGPDAVVSIQESLYKQVQEKLNPTHASGVPW